MVELCTAKQLRQKTKLKNILSLPRAKIAVSEELVAVAKIRKGYLMNCKGNLTCIILL